MRATSGPYRRRAPCRTGTYFCMDLSVTAVVIKGLAEHKDELGAPLCPCRHYDDKAAEAEQGFWNCPCVPMRGRKVSRGSAAATREQIQSCYTSLPTCCLRAAGVPLYALSNPRGRFRRRCTEHHT